MRPTLDHVLKLVLDEFDETPDSLRMKSRRPARKAFAQLAHRQCGLTMLMIAEFLGTSDQAVPKLIQAGEQLEQRDRQYRRTLASILEQLS